MELKEKTRSLNNNISKLHDYLNESEFLCKYWQDCQRVCSSNKECGTKRFYDKYPEWEYIGVGAMMIVPNRFTKEPKKVNI